MTKHLSIILSVTAVLFFASAFIIDISQFGEDWSDFWKNVDVGRVSLIVLINIAAGLFLGLFFFRRRTYRQRFSLTVPIAFILFSIADFGTIFIHQYRLSDEYNHFTAKRDIKNGKVQLLTAGLILPSGNEEEQKAEEGIRNEFGYKSLWIGCTWTPGVEKYNTVVENYLDKRNGNGWRNRMQQRINSLRKSELP